MKTSLTPHTTGSDLFDEVALEGDVLRGLVQNGHGDDVAESLNLVDDGVGVRKVLAVIHVNRPVSDHLVQLVVDALWKKNKNKRSPPSIYTKSKICFIHLFSFSEIG